MPVRSPRPTHTSGRAVALLTGIVLVAGSAGLAARAVGSGGSGADDGRLPAGLTALDDTYPGVTRLDPALRGALRRAAVDARRGGVTIYVNSGWRSPEYQQELLDEAVETYGTAAEAARWVATPTTSPHVRGEAVDIGDEDATEWIADHGSGYGLCRVYDNEPWHVELRPTAPRDGCPATYVDPTQDPRMRP